MSRTNGFDRIARAYRWMELAAFGGALDTCRRAQMDRLLQARRALVLGDGDGRFTAALMTANPTVQVVAIDASPAMLSLLTTRVARTGRSERLITLQGHLPGLLDPAPQEPPGGPTWPPGGFDLVVSHFFLDCLTTAQVTALARSVRPRLASGALWVISEFAAPSPGARALIAVLYLGFGMLTGLATRELPEYEQGLRTAGFVVRRKISSCRGLLVSSLWAAPSG